MTLYLSADTAYLLSENRIKANPNLSALFAGLTQIKQITFEKYSETELWFDTSEVVSMFGMFSGLTELEQVDNLGLLNTSKVQNMHDLFYNCGSLANIGDVKSWDVSNVVTMISMFCWNDDDWFNVSRTSAWTTLDLSGWDVTNVRSVYHMFAGCYTVTEINLTWKNTQNITNIEQLFYKCKALTTIVGLDTLDTTNVTTMKQTFDLCSAITSLDLSTWNTQKVTDMQFMFSNCNVLEVIYVGDDWSTEQVTLSKGMFGWCLKLNENCSTENSDLNSADNEYVDKTHANTGTDGYLTYKSVSDAG